MKACAFPLSRLLAILVAAVVGVQGHVRSLQAATSTTTCSWSAYASNVDTAGFCTVGDNYFLSIQAEPATFIAKALTRLYARNWLCSQKTNKRSCAGGPGCSWDGASCSNTELQGWNWYSQHTFLDQAPAWMFCPSSQAQMAKVCLDLTGSKPSCLKHKGCSWNAEDEVCEASFLHGLRPAQRDAWSTKWATLNPEVHGACESACYLGRAAAGKLPGQYDNGEWGRTAAAASGACAAVPSGSKCRRLRQGKAAPAVNTARVAKYKSWVQSSKTHHCMF